MDVQFSGAVDFSPLFSQRTPSLVPAPERSNPLQSDMLHSQNAILQPLNQAEMPWMTGSFDTGTVINEWA